MSSIIAFEYYEKFLKLKLKVVIHCKNSNDKQKKFLKDVNNYWTNFDIVIISPSIEAGVDFNKEYFDKIYVILSDKSTSQRGLTQMIKRIRNIKCKKIHTFLNGLPYNETGHFYLFNDVEEMAT